MNGIIILLLCVWSVALRKWSVGSVQFLAFCGQPGEKFRSVISSRSLTLPQSLGIFIFRLFCLQVTISFSRHLSATLSQEPSNQLCLALARSRGEPWPPFAAGLIGCCFVAASVASAPAAAGVFSLSAENLWSPDAFISEFGERRAAYGAFKALFGGCCEMHGSSASASIVFSKLFCLFIFACNA